jgi:hypothetical protein
MGTATKDSTIVIDDWAVLSGTGGGEVRVGATQALTTTYAHLLAIEVAPVEAVAQVGVHVRVDISYDDQVWITHQEMVSRTVTADTTLTDTVTSATDTVLGITDGEAFGLFERFFIKDGTIANSETATCVANSTGSMTLASGLANGHASGLSIYNDVDQWTVDIPISATGVRVLYFNVDSDCDVATSSRISVVTNLAA